MPGATQKQVVRIAAGVVALSVGGTGIAHGSSHPSAHPAKKAKGKKKSHVLSVEYKTFPVSVIDEGPNTVEFADDATLHGRPFGRVWANMDEDSVRTYNTPFQSNGIQSTDYSGAYHTTFRASVPTGGGSGTFRGFYDYSVDSNGSVSSAITGVITGGSYTFKGATGSFKVLDLVNVGSENVKYEGHWQGSIRY
jgi:hypothetical protein